MRAFVAGAALVLTSVLTSQASAQGVPTPCKAMVAKIGEPVIRDESIDQTVLCRLGYVLAHDNGRKTPAWVVERLSVDKVVGPADRKALKDPFKADPTLQELGLGFARPADYQGKKSVRDKRKFDQGHMAPAADMKFVDQAMIESFYMSNMAPQQGNRLNRHIWADLEALARDWACDRKDVYVITGPIYDEEEPDTLGNGEVAVPNAFYKMVYEPKQLRLITFILPNVEVDKKGKKPSEALLPFIQTLSDVETRTGIRFLSKLAPRERNRLAKIKSPMWPVIKGCPAE